MKPLSPRRLAAEREQSAVVEALAAGDMRPLRKKGSKYRNCPTVVDGVRFASKREARRWTNLRLLQMAGEIEELERQPRYPLIVEHVTICTYVGDFSYREKGKLVCEDVKGVLTEVFKLKARLFVALYPEIELRLT